MQRTRVNWKREVDTGILMWPMCGKKRVMKQVERLSLNHELVVESQVEGGLVGRPMPLPSRCEFIRVTVKAILKVVR